MAVIMSQSRSMELPNDSDDEAPVVQLCCLPLVEVLTLDLRTTEDSSILLEIVAIGDEARALSVLSKKYLAIRKAIEAGEVDILYRAMKHESRRIRANATSIVAKLFDNPFEKVKKVCKHGYIEALVAVINKDKSWVVKKTCNSRPQKHNMP